MLYSPVLSYGRIKVQRRLRLGSVESSGFNSGRRGFTADIRI